FVITPFSIKVWEELSMAEKEKKTKVSVTINHQSYTIVGTESEEHVEKVAQLVNEKMEAIRESNKHLDTTKLAVLTALNTMNDLLLKEKEYEELLTLLEEEN